MFQKTVLILLIFLSSLSAYHELDINMNNDELESGIKFDLAQFSKRFNVNRYFLGLDYLYIENDDRDNDSLISFDFMMKNRLKQIKAITFGLGGKVLSTSSNSNNVTAIPLGLYMNFLMPVKSFPISFSAQFYYSPKPLTFEDGDQYFEQRYELIFEVIKRGKIYIGYRDILVNRTLEKGGGDFKVSQIPYIGLKFGF